MPLLLYGLLGWPQHQLTEADFAVALGLRPGREENSTFTSFTSREALAPFTPLLRIGECIHVGKNAVFGNGWFVIRETVAGRR